MRRTVTLSIKTITKFTYVIGYYQPDLSTNNPLTPRSNF